MKEEIDLHPKLSLFLIVTFILIIFGLVNYLKNNQIRHNDSLRYFVQKDIKGRVSKLIDLSRGTFSIEITQKDSLVYTSPSLPIAWEIERYKIEVGDSISKEAESKVITFYKFQNGLFNKIVDCKI